MFQSRSAKTEPTTHSTGQDDVPTFADIVKQVEQKKSSQRDSPMAKMNAARKTLHFTNQSRQEYSRTCQQLMAYFDIVLKAKDYHELVENTRALEDEPMLCELIIKLVEHTESVLELVEKVVWDIVKLMEKAVSTYHDNVPALTRLADQCALHIYDTYQTLRWIRSKIKQVAQVYHIPFSYDREDGQVVLLRESLRITWKNLEEFLSDMETLNEALFQIRMVDAETSLKKEKSKKQNKNK